MTHPDLCDPDVTLLLEESVRKALLEAPEQMRKAREEAERKRYSDDRTGVCVVCCGTTVAKVTREYLGDPMHLIIGPGSANQMTRVHHGFHCTSCGLRYEFPIDEATATELRKP